MGQPKLIHVLTPSIPVKRAKEDGCFTGTERQAKARIKEFHKESRKINLGLDSSHFVN